MSDAPLQSSEHTPINDGATDTMSTAPEPPATSGDAPARPAMDDGDEGEDEEEDKEPNLKYTRLTSSLASLYRGGDSSSAFAVTGDKMVCSETLNHPRESADTSHPPGRWHT
jgi:hypothetical protein